MFQWITKEWSSLLSVIFDIGHVRYELVSSFLRKTKIPVLYINILSIWLYNIICRVLHKNMNNLSINIRLGDLIYEKYSDKSNDSDKP